MTTGRTGSDYLQCCLDGVPGIITLTGKTYFKNFFNSSNFDKFKHKKKNVINKFLIQYNNLFTIDKLENKKIYLNKKKFLNKFLINVKNLNLNKRNFIRNIFKTYEDITRDKFNKSSCIVNHSHGLEETDFFLKIFPNCKLLVTIRDPLSNLYSGIVNWKKYTKNSVSQHHNYSYVKRIRIDLKYALNLKNKVFFVQLENCNEIQEKKKLLKFIGVKYSDKVKIATYNNKVWIGDKLSQTRSLKGKFNKNVLKKNYYNFFTKSDLFLLKYFYKDYQKFKYHKESYNFKKKLTFLFLSLSPLSFELNEIKRKPLKISSYYYYLKRVILFITSI